MKKNTVSRSSLQVGMGVGKPVTPRLAPSQLVLPDAMHVTARMGSKLSLLASLC